MTVLSAETEAQKAGPASPRPSHLLERRLEALRRRYLAVVMVTGLALILAVTIELIGLAMFVDWWLELPWVARLLSLLAQLGFIAWLFYRWILEPVVWPPDDDEFALMVEQACPQFRTRLIASIQLTRPGAIPANSSAAMVTALVDETEQLARPNDFRQIVPTDRLKKFGLLALFIPLLAIAGFGHGPETCSALLKRVFLSSIPVPRKTRIQVPAGNQTIGRGDAVRLEAFVQGIIPERGQVELRAQKRRPQQFSLEQDRADLTRFIRTIENVQDDFEYQFSLGDGVSPTYRITAIPRPMVGAIECEQEFPAYSGLPPTKRALGDLSLLAGSVLKLTVLATKDLASAAIRLVGIESNIVMELSPESRRRLTGQFQIPTGSLAGFQIQMVDTEQMESRDNAVYRIDVLPDKAPAVRLTYPDRKEELITRHATMILGFEASDDFQLERVRLKYKIDTVNQGAEKTIELDLENQHPKRLRRRHEWNVGAFTPLLSEGSIIEYWIEAQDNNTVTGPGIGQTDHQLARIVSEAEKRADLLNRAGDYLGSISDVAADQERLNRNLGLIIRAKAGLR